MPCRWDLADYLSGFPHSSIGKESTCHAGDPSLIPGSGRSAGEEIGYPLQYSWASLVAQLVNSPSAKRDTWVWSLGWEDPLEKRKATHSSILTWRTQWGHEELDMTIWAAAHQASLAYTVSQNFLELMSIESAMPSNHSILSHPFLLLPSIFLSIRVFSSELASDGHSIGASASASVLPINSQGWFPLELTSLISLQSKGLSRVFSRTTVKKHQFFGT